MVTRPRAWWIGWLWVLTLSPLPAAVTDTVLTIGEELTVVREIRPLTVVRGDQELVLTGIPQQADLSTLTLRIRRVPVQLREWRWADSVEDELGAVNARIHVPVGGTHPFEVTYQVPGISWRADYRITPHPGSGQDRRTPQITVVGSVHLENTTARTFRAARIILVGADPRQRRQVERRPGILQLADHPLAAAWQPVRLDPPVTQRYVLPHRIEVAAQGVTQAEWIRAEPISFAVLHVMDARRMPLATEEEDYPLTHYWVLRNRADEGLGWPLPPGRVVFERGGDDPVEEWLAHTAVDGEIRLALGPDVQVRGRRERRFRTIVRDGRFEEMYTLSVHNYRDHVVDIEVREKSRPTAQGQVIHATHEYEIRDGTILLRAAIPAGQTWTADLRLRLRSGYYPSAAWEH